MTFNNKVYTTYCHGTVKCSNDTIYKLLLKLQKQQKKSENEWLLRRSRISGEFQDLQLDYIDKLILKDMDTMMEVQTDLITKQIHN